MHSTREWHRASARPVPPEHWGRGRQRDDLLIAGLGSPCRRHRKDEPALPQPDALNQQLGTGAWQRNNVAGDQVTRNYGLRHRS